LLESLKEVVTRVDVGLVKSVGNVSSETGRFFDALRVDRDQQELVTGAACQGLGLCTGKELDDVCRRD
jgi:hypothetical protein